LLLKNCQVLQLTPIAAKDVVLRMLLSRMGIGIFVTSTANDDAIGESWMRLELMECWHYQEGYSMFVRRTSIMCAYLFFCLFLFASCAQNARPTVVLTPAPGEASPKALTQTAVTPPSTSLVSSTPNITPVSYTSRVLLSEPYRPDDLAFDPAGHLVFSDVFHGTVNRLNANGSVTTLIRGLAAPEGLVFLSDGTLIIAEQQTNRILALPPASSSLSILRILPGRPSSAPCKDGVDGIALDTTTETLIIPDSPTGDVYRMSLDGKKMNLLASHIPRPVGAAVDTQGNVYIADECGGALWEITSGGKTIRTGGFGMLDDVAFDPQGNILVTDLKPSIHALIRLNLLTGKREVLASQGFIEPQGLVVDARGDIYLSDDYADKIVEYIPRAAQ
jgi:sugar lactone lactonase YvrE